MDFWCRRFGRRVDAHRGAYDDCADRAIAIRSFATPAMCWIHFREIHMFLMSREPGFSAGRSRQPICWRDGVSRRAELRGAKIDRK